MTQRSPDTRVFSDLEHDAYAMIGGVLGFWAEYENAVDDLIHWVERAPYRPELYERDRIPPPPQLTDLKAFRSFKERKGYLRRLVEQAGTRDHLRRLDSLVRAAERAKQMRHDFAHERISIRLPSSLDDEAKVYGPRDIIIEVMDHLRWTRYKATEIIDMLHNLKRTNAELGFLRWALVEHLRQIG